MIFKGSGTALITPFKDDSVNFDAFKRQLNYQLNNGTSAVIVLGTTGEPFTMSSSEKAKTIEFALEHINGKIPVIVGAGTNSTNSSIDNAKNAVALGADALLVVTPYYNKCTQNGLVKHFFAIADSITKPIIVYNVPSRTGMNILPETYLKLSSHPNIVAIKEASGNITQVSETAALVKDKMDIYSGDDALTLPILALGGKGIISVASNIIPRIVTDLCKYFFDNDLSQAREIQLKILPLVKLLFSEVSPIPIKAAMNMLNFDAGTPRLPLTEMENQIELKKVLKSLLPDMFEGVIK